MTSWGFKLPDVLRWGGVLVRSWWCGHQHETSPQSLVAHLSPKSCLMVQLGLRCQMWIPGAGGVHVPGLREDRRWGEQWREAGLVLQLSPPSAVVTEKFEGRQWLQERRVSSRVPP